MNKFDALSQKMQKWLNVTNFTLANIFLAVSFIFFFIVSKETISHQKTKDLSDYLFLTFIGFIFILAMNNNKKSERKFLKEKKNPIKLNPRGLSTLQLMLIFPTVVLLLFFLITGNLPDLLMSFSFGCFYLSSRFINSTPVAPKNKKASADETKP